MKIKKFFFLTGCPNSGKHILLNSGCLTWFFACLSENKIIFSFGACYVLTSVKYHILSIKCKSSKKFSILLHSYGLSSAVDGTYAYVPNAGLIQSMHLIITSGHSMFCTLCTDRTNWQPCLRSVCWTHMEGASHCQWKDKLIKQRTEKRNLERCLMIPFFWAWNWKSRVQ